MENGRRNNRIFDNFSDLHGNNQVDQHELLHIVCNTYIDLKNIEKLVQKRIKILENKFHIKLEEWYVYFFRFTARS